MGYENDPAASSISGRQTGRQTPPRRASAARFAERLDDEMIGNSVSPLVMKAIAGANVADLGAKTKRAKRRKGAAVA